MPRDHICLWTVVSMVAVTGWAVTAHGATATPVFLPVEAFLPESCHRL